MNEKNTFFAPFKGVVLAYIITMAVFAAYAALLTYTNLSEKNNSLVVLITMSVSLILGGMKGAASAKSKGWLVGAMTGFFYVIAMVLTGLSVLPDFALGTKTLVCLGLGVASGAIGGMFGINFSKK